MSSTPAPRDDRTARARIRDAAITVFAREGMSAATARAIAAEAGVSPGLVMHHFGTMDGLREACDRHVAAVVREQKHEALGAGPTADVLALLRDADAASTASITGYVARALVEDTEPVRELVDELVADAQRYLEDGVESGTIQPSDDPDARAVVLTLWSLGSIVLHRHLDRLLGVDPTRPEVLDDPTAGRRYAAPVLDILGRGVLTPEFAEQARAAYAAWGEDAPTDTTTAAPRRDTDDPNGGRS